MTRINRIRRAKGFFIFCLSGLLCACLYAQAAVTLTNQKISLSSQNVTMRSDHTIASINSGTVMLSLDAPIMENEYLKVTLLPGWGGRVRSIVYKPTGNEETNPGQIGGPSSMGAGSFFYDYLWVIGGFYPTIGPEHGKYFNLPWDWKVLTNTKDTAAIAMYQVDSIPWRQGYAGKFSAYNATNIQVEYIVRLVTGKTGYETEVIIKNPDSRSKSYEYWESCSMFPGNSGSSGGYEFITPETKFQIDSWCTGIMNVDKSAGANYFVYFDKLRFLKNWPAAGIMYGHNYPFNFWGVIDHNDAREEGIMRVCDNKYTIGVKIWGAPPSLFEIWPGTCNRFFSPATLQANQTITWKAWYTPTVGLTSVTDASEHMLINLTTDKTAYDGNVDQTVQVACQAFCVMPAKAVHARLRLEGGGSVQTICDTVLTPDPKIGNVIRRAVPVKSIFNGTTTLTASFADDAGGSALLAARKALSFTNANPVVGVLTGTAGRVARGQPRRTTNVFSLDGRLLHVMENAPGFKSQPLGQGVYLLQTDNGHVRKVVRTAVW